MSVQSMSLSLERNKSCECNICMRQRRMFLISLENERCGITEEARPVSSISATRKRNVTLAANDASLNRRSRCTLNIDLFVLNVANMYVLNTRT